MHTDFSVAVVLFFICAWFLAGDITESITDAIPIQPCKVEDMVLWQADYPDGEFRCTHIDEIDFPNNERE